METLTDRIVSVTERELECLRDIVGMHMVDGFHPFVRQLQQLTMSNVGKNVRIEMPSGIYRLPPRPNNVTWMQNHRARIASPSSVEQQLFYRGLQNSVVAERMSRILFGRRYNSGTPVHPDRATMEEQRTVRL